MIHLAYEIEDIEGLELTVGEVTVDGVLFVVEDLEDRRELRHDQKLDVAAIKGHFGENFFNLNDELQRLASAGLLTTSFLRRARQTITLRAVLLAVSVFR